MKKIAIHQFHSGSACGDAVTNALFLIQRMLHRLGFASDIFVEHVAPELKGLLNNYRKLKVTRDDIVFIHHSMGHELTDWVIHLPCRKILVYHNITPVEFFPENSDARRYSRLGREQLKAFLPVMAAAMADSEYNADELSALGYGAVDVIPLLMNVEELVARPWDHAVVQNAAGTFTLLFVGRICPNKCQEDCIAVARHLKAMINRPFRLVLVGHYDANDPYYQHLMEQMAAFDLNNEVLLTGKIPDAHLYGWYRAADAFLCMSEHEGFGVPLIEAMAFDVPVIAFKSSNVAHTLGGAGILVTRKDHESLAALIKLLSEDRPFKRAIIGEQQKRVAEFTEARLFHLLGDFLAKQGVESPKPFGAPVHPATDRVRYQIEGPFETSYSLAIVNRKIALALEKKFPGAVSLFATEGPGDYLPDPVAVSAVPGLEPIWKRGQKGSRAKVVIRNLYPPRVSDMDGRINLLYFAWEESMLPFDWVDQFNRHLDGLPVLSRFIQKILMDNGVFLPMTAAGCGVSLFHRSEVSAVPAKRRSGFTFLHVSSCFPRKGVDVLLKAFAQNFTAKDGVGLVIKTFPNIHNTLDAQIAAVKKAFPNMPPIDIIDRDLSDQEMADLYTRCDVLVAPSRGEGFGLPMAEAMAYKLPVITTAYGGQSDFCTEETSWLVDFSFQPAKSHMGLFDSVWMEPDVDHLGRLMREVRYATPAQLQPRIDAAARRIESEFTWDRCADRLKTLEDAILRQKPLSRKKYRVGWISSWNAKCGIAAYSKFLVDGLPQDALDILVFASRTGARLQPDASNVVRCWTNHNGAIDELLAALEKNRVDALVLQFNFAFFSPRNLERILHYAKKNGIVSILFFHSTADVTVPGLEASLSSIREALGMADRLLVHGVADLNRLKSWGLYQNTALFPHGVIRRPLVPVSVGKRVAGIPVEKTVIASYGFMLPHKGLLPLIEAVALLRQSHPQVHLLMVNALYPVAVSQETLVQCRKAIQAHGLVHDVTLVTEFLEDDASFSLLDAATLVVFPYQNTAESSSAAVRYGLAARRPVVCTPLSIFADVGNIIHFLQGTSAENIAEGVDALLRYPEKLHDKSALQDQWITFHSWEILGKRLGGMILGLLNGLNLASAGLI
ncbi:MAG: glycosyltransferase [Desulfobacterales bacterium]|jgi:glycosyltransferase involved in cell wall biosynthesis|nr:glycosyltransferase [Desulfobacterales bacterium]